MTQEQRQTGAMLTLSTTMSNFLRTFFETLTRGFGSLASSVDVLGALTETAQSDERTTRSSLEIATRQAQLAALLAETRKNETEAEATRLNAQAERVRALLELANAIARFHGQDASQDPAIKARIESLLDEAQRTAMIK